MTETEALEILLGSSGKPGDTFGAIVRSDAAEKLEAGLAELETLREAMAGLAFVGRGQLYASAVELDDHPDESTPWVYMSRKIVEAAEEEAETFDVG